MTLRPRRPVAWIVSLASLTASWLAPTTSHASPPPDVMSVPVALLPTLVAVALLALAGVGCGLLRARQRPGKLFLAVSLAGAAVLCAEALWLDPPFEIDAWSAALHLDAVVLVAVALAAWVWGKGPERGRVPGALLVLVAGTVVAAGLWAAAVGHVARVPYRRGTDVPSECGEPKTWSPQSPPEIPDHWYDYRAAVLGGHERVHQLVVAAPRNDRPEVELFLLQQEDGGTSQVASRTLPVAGEWIGLAADRRDQVYAAWYGADRSFVEVARIGASLEIEQTSTWPAVREGIMPVLTAGEHVCLDSPYWMAGGDHHLVLVLDRSLRPRGRVAAVLSALGDGKGLAGSIALPASVLLLGWAFALRHRLRVRARTPRWEGRLDADFETLVAEDGARVRIVAPLRLFRGCLVGLTYTMGGAGRGEPVGGPYRGAPLVVRPTWAEEGAWRDVLARQRGHLDRVALLAAAVTGVLVVSALDLLFG